MSRQLGRKRWWTRVNAPLLAAVTATAWVSLAYVGHHRDWWQIPGMEKLELATIDSRFSLRGPRQPASDDIVIVGIDDRTRADFPEIFQTRRGFAQLIDAVDKLAPRAIGLDMFFQSPEVSLAPAVVTEVRAAAEAFRAEPEPRTTGGDRALAALDAVVEQTRGDDLLAEAVARSKRVYLGLLFGIATGDEVPPATAAEPPGVGLARYGEAVSVEAPRSRRPPQAMWVARTLPAIAAGAAGAGAVNVLPDSDGQIRQVPLVLEYGGRFYMPLGLSLALAKLGGDAGYVVGEEHIRLGEGRAPISPRAEARLSYLGPNQTFPRISAADLLTGVVAAEQVQGKLVIVGYADVARDKVVTPFDTQLDGVEVHATLAHNLLHGELMRHTSPMTTLATLLLLGLVLTLVQLRPIRQKREWAIGVAALLVIGGYLLAAHHLFSSGLVIEVAAPLGACIFIALVSMATALATEGRDRRALRAAFSQYVSEALVDRIASDPNRAELTLGGVRRELTVLFSDIRGFSRFSEKLEPEVLSRYLNEYLTPMTNLVMRDGGLLDKYIGDAIMAVYGAPLDMDDHAARACATALAMQHTLGPLNDSWRARELPEIAIGIGINSGPMAVGNMGSEARFDYTVMGDAVNLAARLETLTKEYRVDILAGEATATTAAGFVFRELDLVRVAGRQGTARIFELVGREGEAPLSADQLAAFAGALEAYRARDWAAAEEGFSGFLAERPADGPAHVMRDRVRKLRHAPPPSDWDGVYDQVAK